MWAKFIRLFTIKTKFEAFLVIYGLGLGAVERGAHYLRDYPGTGGWLLFAVCPVAVFMAGARILDSLERAKADAARDALVQHPSRKHDVAREALDFRDIPQHRRSRHVGNVGGVPGAMARRGTVRRVFGRARGNRFGYDDVTGR